MGTDDGMRKKIELKVLQMDKLYSSKLPNSWQSNEIEQLEIYQAKPG